MVRMWRKGNAYTFWWKCKLVQSLCKTVWWFLKKLKIELPYDPAMPLLGIYPKEIKSVSQRDICITMFITALLTIAKIWKQPKYPSMDEWITKMWYICICICMYVLQWIYNGISFSHKKRKSCHLRQHGWKFRALC